MRLAERGYTLYEVLLVTTLIAVLLALVIPSYSATLARQRQRVEIDALFHAIHHARKESIMRRRVVSLCPSDDGSTCGPDADWSNGWLMFENRDRDSPPRIDAGEIVIRHHAVDPSVVIAANRRGFTLRATVLRATNGTFVVCDAAGRVPAKALVISYTGRPRVASQTTRGNLYDCTD